MSTPPTGPQPPPWPPPSPRYQSPPPSDPWAQQWAQGSGPPGWDSPTPSAPVFFPPGEPVRDPRAPMGRYVPPAVVIDQFHPASSRRPAIITVVVLVTVALTVWLGFRAAHQVPPIPAAAPSPTATVASQAAANQNSDSIPFVNTFDNAQGVWTIDQAAWSGPRVVLTMTIAVSQGDQVLGFFAFTNADTSQAYEAQPSGRADDLVGRVVRAGQKITGTVTFAMPDAESTVFLVDSTGRQVTALLIPA